MGTTTGTTGGSGTKVGADSRGGGAVVAEGNCCCAGTNGGGTSSRGASTLGTLSIVVDVRGSVDTSGFFMNSANAPQISAPIFNCNVAISCFNSSLCFAFSEETKSFTSVETKFFTTVEMFCWSIMCSLAIKASWLFMC